MSIIESTELTTEELRALARSLRDDRALWEPLVRATPERRHYELLRHDERVTAWVISWMEGHDTGFHDHDISSGAVAVVQGSIREERLRVGGPPASRIYFEGDVLAFEAQDIHRVTHVAGEPAVTIHVYSPPLQRSGAYVFDPGGALRRRPLDASEEIRPLSVYGELRSAGGSPS
jgi:predicted metal-dependent enzyme (double-stranded beta helix superfamily)